MQDDYATDRAEKECIIEGCDNQRLKGGHCNYHSWQKEFVDYPLIADNATDQAEKGKKCQQCGTCFDPCDGKLCDCNELCESSKFEDKVYRIQAGDEINNLKRLLLIACTVKASPEDEAELLAWYQANYKTEADRIKAEISKLQARLEELK